MTEAEKAEANLAVQRFARGVYEKKIPKDAVDEVTKPIAEARDRTAVGRRRKIPRAWSLINSSRTARREPTPP